MHRVQLAASLSILISCAVPASAQTRSTLPFDVSREALAQVDTSALQWTTLRTFTGGVEGSLYYHPGGVTPEQCKAVVVIGMVRMRNLYLQEIEEAPVVLRMDFRCAAAFFGTLRYDGVNTHLQIKDATSGEILYKGRELGLP
ncbi:MAG: hypothetical protein V3U38_06510 [Gemmatimonadota bacterium]